MATSRDDRDELAEIRRLARPIAGPSDFDPLIDRIGEARFVLIGEASHGTSAFYRWRADLSRRLISEEGFSFVAVEGDWPDCYQVNRWVKGSTDHHTPKEVLKQFHRWPMWMWANQEVAEFVQWLREHNRASGRSVGFYGLDVYSLWESLDRIIRYLRDARPDDLESAMDAFRCFEPYGEDPQSYAWVNRMVPDDCEDEVVGLLVEIHQGGSDATDAEAEFDARQNAEVIAGAERYYRTMVRANGESWNVRDLHMADTLDRLIKHHGDDAKAIVWEHNTHVGDARATDMRRAGMVSIGQVVRERHGDDAVVLVGFGTHRGRVVAASGWGDPLEVFEVPPAREGTHEDLLHNGAPEQSLLVFPMTRDGPWLSARRGHRAIGVVYQPELESRRNWVPTIMGLRYDAFIYLDETEALRPLRTLVSADTAAIPIPGALSV
jgi:erythromycin esterase-like protein